MVDNGVVIIGETVPVTAVPSFCRVVERYFQSLPYSKEYMEGKASDRKEISKMIAKNMSQKTIFQMSVKCDVCDRLIANQHKIFYGSHSLSCAMCETPGHRIVVCHSCYIYPTLPVSGDRLNLQFPCCTGEKKFTSFSDQIKEAVKSDKITFILCEGPSNSYYNRVGYFVEFRIRDKILHKMELDSADISRHQDALNHGYVVLSSNPSTVLVSPEEHSACATPLSTRIDSTLTSFGLRIC